MNYLENLYCSGVSPREEISLPVGSEYQAAVQESAKAEKQFYQSLSEEQRDLFYALCRKYAFKANLEDANLFAYAFRLGSRLVLEALRPLH